ncbi:hypothetical protein PFICI_00478 [Pestalotiopsis fici W106-1]|uniref:GRF-type domain-containing protein n=1 Tax=Pestalotiopsis fici (strain W106-1 / CGMCC3.15140) TaxID=1229662 RepID=W3XKY3_PESFW|nr:uncharacterized protein PFICI_00478 [Pestalotiopsis fici W106-1]ETS86650.1 hypothetical protein PFICI_00478 [Pestalotiopsis fici W106-1]
MPRRRTSATTTFGTAETPTKKPDNGYFTKGQWHCNCQPRLPAVQFQVRRESKNKGRWFYTCQIDRTKGKTGEPRKCDFFLWAEDARLREEGALLNNSTTEPDDGEEAGGNGQNTKKSLRTPRKLVQTTLSARVEPREEGKRHWTHRTEITPIKELERTVGGSQSETRSGGGETAKSSSTMRATDSTSSSKTAANTQRLGRDDGEDELAQNGGTASTVAAAQAQQTPSAGTKRKRDVIELSDNDDGDTDDLFGDMDSDEERQLAAIAESSSHPGRKRDAFATPAAQRLSDGATSLPTPSLTGKSVRRVLFAEPEVGEASDANKRQRNNNSGAYTPIGADPKTPSSSQEGVSPSSSQRATPGSSIGDITQEIMDLLKGQQIDELASRKVHSALQRYAAKARGLEKGRDASRQALRNQEVKIAKLQERITNLENARMVDANARKEMKIKLMEMYTHT